MDRLEMEREYDDSSRGRKRDSSLREVKKKVESWWFGVGKPM